MEALTPIRKRILDFLNEFTNENGYPPSIREIGEAVDLRSPSTVHAHIRILREAGYLEKDDRKTRAISLPSRPKYLQVPVVGRVTAGQPILAYEEISGFVPYLGPASGEMFALTVSGDSMTGAAILDGDIVIVRSQRAAANGDIVVALIEDEATVKRLKMRGREVWLMPENEAYAPIDGSNCSILGVVVAVYRPSV